MEKERINHLRIIDEIKFLGRTLIQDYKLLLGFEYGNNDRLVESLEAEIKKYKSCSNIPKCQERILKYEGIIRIAKSHG